VCVVFRGLEQKRVLVDTYFDEVLHVDPLETLNVDDADVTATRDGDEVDQLLHEHVLEVFLQLFGTSALFVFSLVGA